jgi:leader peptidase (prepilin peptidase)/N-methyltransferase
MSSLKGSVDTVAKAFRCDTPPLNLITAALFVLCLIHFGFTLQALMACFFSATLLALAWIDAETFLIASIF